MIENSLNIIHHILNKNISSIDKDILYDFAIGIEHSIFDEYNYIERKYLDYLDLVQILDWHIKQIKECYI